MICAARGHICTRGDRHAPTTHIEPLLRAELLDQQHLWDPKLRPNVRQRLAVGEVLLELDVLPYELHQPEAEGVVVIPNLNRRDLVLNTPIQRLQPSDERLVPLEMRRHALGVGHRVVRPRDAVLDHGVGRHVDDPHFVLGTRVVG